ncbi:MAG: hypothetical protein ACKVOP_03195 [Sphingomonadaceae bacterium]
MRINTEKAMINGIIARREANNISWVEMARMSREQLPEIRREDVTDTMTASRIAGA